MFVPSNEPPGDPDDEALWFCVRGSDVLVCGGDHGFTGDELYLGTLDGRHCWSVDADIDAAAGFVDLRMLYGQVDETTWTVAGRAVQLVAWDRTHRFCGRCGTPTETAVGERAKRCPDCGLLAFPRLAPAVIVLVTRGDELLLARNANFPSAMYSTIAGFVEPGETLEDAVRREVLEEVGVALDGVRYFSSQPWPFPHSLMVGFTAEWASGDIVVDGREIADAQWFHRDALPMVPPAISIARRLIDSFVDPPR